MMFTCPRLEAADSLFAPSPPGSFLITRATYMRSVLAIFTGYFAVAACVVVLTGAAAAAMHVQPGHPTTAYVVVNVIGSIFAAAVGGYLAARIAPRAPMLHGAILAGIILVLAALLYHAAPSGQTVAYRVLLIACPPPAVLAGAALGARSGRFRF